MKYRELMHTLITATVFGGINPTNKTRRQQSIFHLKHNSTVRASDTWGGGVVHQPQAAESKEQ